MAATGLSVVQPRLMANVKNEPIVARTRLKVAGAVWP